VRSPFPVEAFDGPGHPLRYEPAEIARANGTSRARGAVGRDPLAYRPLLAQPPEHGGPRTVLDYGVGRGARHLG
jgi:hypothetical protein